MIAADTSTWIAFLEGAKGQDVNVLDQAPTELLSDPNLPRDVAETLSEIPLMKIEAGYWSRAAALRAKALARRRKARLGDALIAQSCIDTGVLLITRDKDFSAFAVAAELDLVVGP